jgi:hypothetical protein
MGRERNRTPGRRRTGPRGMNPTRVRHGRLHSTRRPSRGTKPWSRRAGQRLKRCSSRTARGQRPSNRHRSERVWTLKGTAQRGRIRVDPGISKRARVASVRDGGDGHRRACGATTTRVGRQTRRGKNLMKAVAGRRTLRRARRRKLARRVAARRRSSRDERVPTSSLECTEIPRRIEPHRPETRGPVPMAIVRYIQALERCLQVRTNVRRGVCRSRDLPKPAPFPELWRGTGSALDSVPPAH